MAKTKYTLEYHPTGKILEGKKVKNNYVYGFSYNKLLYKGKTKYQSIELYDTPWLGKLLKLDGYFQTSEKDEFFYHEAMTHPAMFVHPKPEKILIIGGGDCGILKNTLMHETVRQVLLVEIDKKVIEFSKKYLDFVHKKAYLDQRAKIIISDGKKFIEKTKEKFDIIISDLTDPVGPSKALYTANFYKTVAQHLNKNGIFMTHLDMIFSRPELSKWIYKNLRSVFKFCTPFVSYVPLYGTLMAFSINSNFINAGEINIQSVKKRLKTRRVKNLKWYSPKIHKAIFVLPPYLEKLFRRIDL